MTISSNTRCLLDSNILIAYSIAESVKFKKAHLFFEQIANNKIHVFVSTQNLLEFAAVLNRAYNLPRKIIATGIHNFIIDPLFEIIYPKRETIDVFINLLNKKTSLHPTDIFLIATAITNNIDMIVSDDSDFNKIKEIKVYNPFT